MLPIKGGKGPFFFPNLPQTTSHFDLDGLLEYLLCVGILWALMGDEWFSEPNGKRLHLLGGLRFSYLLLLFDMDPWETQIPRQKRAPKTDSFRSIRVFAFPRDGQEENV